MQVSIKPDVPRWHPDFFERLQAALAAETFASACVVAPAGAALVHIYCPDCPGGVIAEIWCVEGWYFDWIRAELKHSVMARGQGIRPAA